VQNRPFGDDGHISLVTDHVGFHTRGAIDQLRPMAASADKAKERSHKSQMIDQELANRTEELSDEELNQVSGGINPQPLPPRHHIVPPNPM
jgi:bacteriocin-like protein